MVYESGLDGLGLLFLLSSLRLPACLPAYLPICLPICLSVYLPICHLPSSGVYRQWVTYGISSYMKKPQAIIDAAIVPPELMRPNGRVDCVEVSVVDIVRFDAPKFFPRVEEGRPGFAAPKGIDYRTLEVFLSCLKPSSSSSSSSSSSAKPPAALKICFRVFTPLTDM
eukprot:GHVU01011500.1.p1 GENE.GHVU01011500.1~~GHVU01011500.1.p1  ORF type:complete len:168 (-),score=27.73 GHVU01011500.1:1179-1682(-)